MCWNISPSPVAGDLICNSVELCHPHICFSELLCCLSGQEPEAVQRQCHCEFPVHCLASNCSLHSASLVNVCMTVCTKGRILWGSCHSICSVEMLFVRLWYHVDEVVQSDYILSFFFNTVQVEITVRVSSHNYFYWHKIIDELTDWKHFQDAKFRQILKFDSVVVEGGGGKYDIVCIWLYI